MTESEELLAWATLVRTPGLDLAGLSTALDLLGSAGALVSASKAGWERAALPPAAQELLQSKTIVRVRC